MKLVGAPSMSPSEWYESVARSEYERLLQRKMASGVSGGLEEVKLHLFLSLLESPGSADSQVQGATKRAANA
jgi:hypothetical protein